MLTALVSTGIFLLQFVISVFFGDLDMDVDGDANADFDLGSLFSFKGLVHFLIGAADNSCSGKRQSRAQHSTLNTLHTLRPKINN